VARVRGNFKSLLKRLPDAVAAELRDQLTETGRTVLARARALAPVYRGRARKGRTPGTLRASLSARVLAKGLKLKVGIVGKPAARQAYYARFVEFGHRIGYRGNRLAKQPPITARGTARKIILLRRRREIRQAGVRARPFLYTFSRAELYHPFQKLWGKALQRAAQGTSNE
jgi:hypothetical protein